MDVAWKVGNGSLANDWELRMSLRSFNHNYLDRGKFWVIGHIPTWLDQDIVNCVPWTDPYRRCKDANLIHKAISLAMEPSLSDPFIFCSDDQLLIRPCTSSDFHLWHRGQLAKKATEHMNKWEKRLVHTGQVLRRAGYPSKHFDCHVPYPMFKSWVRQALKFDFATPPGMCVHTTILNGARQDGVPWNEFSTLAWLGADGITPAQSSELLQTRRFAGLNNRALRNSEIVAMLNSFFPHPAPWETDAGTLPRFTALEWVP